MAHPDDDDNFVCPECSPTNGTCRFSGGVANVAVTAVGAGMLAMPKAFSEVGLALGIALTALVSARRRPPLAPGRSCCTRRVADSPAPLPSPRACSRCAC